MAAALHGKAGDETINARVDADTSQARHLGEGVAAQGSARKAPRRTQGTAVQQRQRPTSERQR